MDYALKFYPVYPNAENQTSDFTPIILSYGAQVYMIYTQSQEDDYTVVSTYLCNAVNSTPIAGSNFTIRLRGHSFSGWNRADLVEENGSQNLIVSDEKIQNQTPFTVNSQFNSVAAKWLVNLYDVTYYLNGGVYDGSSDVRVIEDVPFGSTITLISDQALTREDFWFEGWSLKSSGQNQTIDFSYNGEEVVVEKDIQLYAVWSQKYYINLYADITRETSARITVDRDGTYDLTGAEISGFTFTKFNTTTLGDGTEYVVGTNLIYGLEENTNLYAMWFNVSFADGNDNNYGVTGTTPNSFSVTYGASFTLPANPYTCYPYYKFNNWNYGSEIGLDFFTANEESTSFAMTQANVNKDIQFVADWLYKNIKLNVYTNQNKTKLHYSKIIDVNKYEVETLYQANAQFPSIENKEIDYFTDGTTAFFTVADVSGNKVEISIPKPQEGMTFDSSSDAYIYNIYPMWKLTAQFLGNNRSSDQEIKYISAVYSDVNENGKIELSEISTEYIFELIENPFVFENRSFVGWATTNNATEGDSAGTEVSLTRDVVYYAIWEFKNFTIQFSDTQNTFTNGTFMYNEVKTLIDCGFPEDLTGYVTNYYDATAGYYKNFVGFTYNNGEERLFIKPTDELTFASLIDGGFIANDEFASDNTIVLTAAWEEQVYTITVDLLGGSLQDLSLLNGIDVQYLFDNDEQTYKLKYTVKYSEVKSSSNGLSLIYDSLSKDKFRFNGFAPTDTSVSMVIAPGAASGEYIYKYASDAQTFNATAGDVINVVWQEVYSLAFNANGANGQIDGQSADAINGSSTFTIPADTNVIVYPYAGVTFVGWWFTNDVNDIKQNLASLYTWGDSVVVNSQVMSKYGVENIVTLYAVWQTTVTFQTELQGVTVTGYHTPAGDVETGLTYFTDIFYCGDNVTADVLLSYYFTISSDGYQFSGWQKDGVLINEITITQPVTLTASWGNSYISIYLKNYDGNDFANASGEVTPVEFEILYDPSVSIDLNNYYKEEAGSSSLPARFGYEFIGWKVGLTNTVVSASKVGELTIYNSTNKFALPNSSITLYAVYKIAQVRVVYDINNEGATNNEGESNKIVEGLEYNTAYKITGADYTLDYHKIVAWTYVDEQGNTLESEVGESVSLLKEYGVVQAVSGEYILTLSAKWERISHTVQINLGSGLFFNTGLDEENPLPSFYGVDDRIIGYEYDVDKIILEVYEGNISEGYGFKVPGTEYVSHTELFEVVSYSDRNGNSYYFDTLYSVTEDVTLNADWVRIVEIHVYKNLGDSKDEIVFRAQLNSNLDLSIKNNAPHINETAITFTDDNYNLISYNSNALGTGKGYSIEAGFVVLNATNFTIKTTYKMDLFCQWQGDPISITIDYNDTTEEENETHLIIQNDTLKYGNEVDLTQYIPTSRVDGNMGYEFASFADEFSNLYYGENLIFKTGELDFQESYVLSVNWKAKQFVLTYELPSALYNGDMSDFIETPDPDSGVVGGGKTEDESEVEALDDLPETEPIVDRSKFSKMVEYGSTVTLIDSTLIINTTNNEEFPILVFDGYESSVTINNSNKINSNFTMPASDVLLTGLWKSRNFMLVINAGEGRFEDGTNTKSLTGFDFSQEVELSIEDAPIRDGYTLQYKYDYFYEESAGSFTKTKLIAPGDDFNFTLYNSTAEDDGTGEPGLAGDLAYIWDEELESFVINLTAVWTPIQYVVVFDKNTPSTQNGYEVNASGSVEGSIADIVFTYDQAQDISSCKYSLIGWTLIGWNTQADGQGSTVLISKTGQTLVNNLTTVAGTSVTLYAMWQQNEYTLTFEDLSGENTGANAIESQDILFDSIFVLDDLIFTAKPIVALTFDLDEGVYKEFVGWRYIYNGNLSDRIYTNDQEILFALAANSGFVGNVEDLEDNVVALRAEWQEVSYDLVLDLKGATYSNTRNKFDYTFNSDTRTFNIIISVKYSDLSNGSGIDLTAEGIEFNSSKIVYDYAFAGWSKESNVNTLHFADGENIKFEGLTKEQLDPTQENIFKVYAMFDIYKVTVNGNGGTVIADKESEIAAQKWSV
ncbi:MAG: InlB B-repeat-containing protein, partial [Clostridia bacterium]|nr:InlB B-repeat-containing protein [Clostridia bacterium]